LGSAPFRFDEILFFETDESGVEGTLVYAQHIVGDLVDALLDTPAVTAFVAQGAEGEETESALKKTVGEGVMSFL